MAQHSCLLADGSIVHARKTRDATIVSYDVVRSSISGEQVLFQLLGNVELLASFFDGSVLAIISDSDARETRVVQRLDQGGRCIWSTMFWCTQLTACITGAGNEVLVAHGSPAWGRRATLTWLCTRTGSSNRFTHMPRGLVPLVVASYNTNPAPKSVVVAYTTYNRVVSTLVYTGHGATAQERVFQNVQLSHSLSVDSTMLAPVGPCGGLVQTHETPACTGIETLLWHANTASDPDGEPLGFYFSHNMLKDYFLKHSVALPPAAGWRWRMQVHGILPGYQLLLFGSRWMTLPMPFAALQLAGPELSIEACFCSALTQSMDRQLKASLAALHMALSRPGPFFLPRELISEVLYWMRRW